MASGRNIIQAKKQDFVNVSDKPIGLGGRVESVRVDDLSRSISQVFCEKADASIVLMSNFPENITGNLTSAQLRAQFERLLAESRSDLAICAINDQVGYGVFALSDIPKDTVICFYSGSLKPHTQVKMSQDHAIGCYGIRASYSTASHRGIASFMQHLPTPLKFQDAKIFSNILRSMGQDVSEADLKINDELYAIQFVNGEVRESIALENVRREYINYNNVPIVLFVTDRLIRSGEQVGFNYGKDYWLSRNMVPELFDKMGRIISPDRYKRTFACLKLGPISYTGELSPLIKQISEKRETVDLIDDSKTPRKVGSIIVLDELLRVRAISENQYHELRKYVSFQSGGFSLYPSTVDRLVVKYGLENSDQISLERGLRKAAANNQIEDLNIFIKLVKNVNAKDSNPSVGRTALHWAAVKENKECYELLIAAGADPALVDANNIAALSVGK